MNEMAAQVHQAQETIQTPKYGLKEKQRGSKATGGNTAEGNSGRAKFVVAAAIVVTKFIEALNRQIDARMAVRLALEFDPRDISKVCTSRAAKSP